MPSSPNYKRDYKQEIRTQKKRDATKADPKGTRKRVARNKARAAAIKAGMADPKSSVTLKLRVLAAIAVMVVVLVIVLEKLRVVVKASVNSRTNNNNNKHID
jgi:hypothetical protein